MEMPKNLVSGSPSDRGLLAAWSERRRLRDYAVVGQRLFLQRITIYSFAILLTGMYYSWHIAGYFYAAVWFCEAYDALVFRSILRRRNLRTRDFRRLMVKLYLGTIMSAATISLFCISIAIQQGHNGGHFLPLFLLVSASIFAAMNNHHFLPVLGLRLSFYILTILFIPLRDVWIVRPPLSSEIWLNLLTVLFVLGFIMELARSFLRGYSSYLVSRRELEEEHQRTLAAYHAKTRFLATVSHELRTPLTSIKGALDILNSGALGPAPEGMQRLLQVAGRNSGRLSDLVSDLLFLQTSDSGRMELSLAALDIGEVVLDAVERIQPYAEKMGASVRTSAVAGQCWVNGDYKRIEQVLVNLLSNASKFSKTGGEVCVFVEEIAGNVRVSVKDQGIGIPDGAHTQVFEEFTQLDSRDERKFEGSGLGLSISRRIVEAHGGTIAYDSVLGVGTVFYFDLKSVPNPQNAKRADAA